MNMTPATVDVIIPSYNRSYCVASAIDSALGQSQADCRVILVDDGSTDDTAAMIARRYAGDRRLVYLRQANAGVSAARNAGLARVTGDYVAFLDSDDCWKPGKIALQLACLRRLPGVGMVWTDMDAIDSVGKLLRENYLKVMYSAYQAIKTQDLFEHSGIVQAAGENGDVVARPAYWGDIFSQMILGNLVHTSTVLLTRERALKVGRFNEALRDSGEDFDFHLRTCREGPVAFIDACTIRYRVGNEDQLTQPAFQARMAMNYLSSILPVLAQDRARITVSDNQLRRKIARTRAHIAYWLLNGLAPKDARRFAWLSLRGQPLAIRTWSFLLASFLPVPALGRALAGYRTGRQWVRSLSVGPVRPLDDAGGA